MLDKKNISVIKNKRKTFFSGIRNNTDCAGVCPFNGHYVGLHAHYAFYNIGGIGVTDYMKEHRFEGWLVGGGFSYGYHWILTNRWSLEAKVGIGYTYLNYELYPCDECGDKLGDRTKHYVGPTQLGVSLIYILK